MGFFKKFKEAWLASMTFDRLDDDFYEELEEADVLYGVTMQEKGVSRILTINLNDMAKELHIK